MWDGEKLGTDGINSAERSKKDNWKRVEYRNAWRSSLDSGNVIMLV